MKKLFTAVMLGLFCIVHAGCAQQDEPLKEQVMETKEEERSEEERMQEEEESEKAKIYPFTGEELVAALENDDAANRILIDVREENEFAAGHIAGAVNIPLSVLESRLSEIEDHKNKQIILYCNTGNRSGKAADILVKNGFTKIYNAEGVKQFEYELVQ